MSLLVALMVLKRDRVMFRNSLVAVVAVLAFVAIPASASASTSLSVPATSGPTGPGFGGTGFTNSGVTLAPDESVVITASGSWTCDAFNGTIVPGCTGGPGGAPIPPGDNSPPFLQEQLNAFSLIGSLDGGSTWQEIGSGPTTVTGPGTLIFGYNDNGWGDNGGSVSVTISPVDNDLALSGMPSDQTVNATSPSGAVVNYTSPTAVDEDLSTVIVHCSSASGSTFPIGTTKVSCTAGDTDGDTNSPVSASFNITVLGASGQLAPLCTASHGVGPGTSLADKCAAAQAALAAGDPGDATSILNAYINELQAQRGKSIPASTANSLIAAAQQIVAVIGP